VGSRGVAGWCLGGVSPTGVEPGGGAVGYCFVPAVLESGEEAVFDFGGDVGVDSLDLVLEGVAEAAGLGDVGDGVGDHPGFVAVAKAVEG
jgi:hypothetical protein